VFKADAKANGGTKATHKKAERAPIITIGTRYIAV